MSRFLRLESRSSRSGSRWSCGFTLLEMLVASAILVIMGALLISVTDTAGKVYGLAQSQNEYRMRARAVLDYMGQDMRHASLAVNQSVAVTSTPQVPTLEFLVNPTTLAAGPYNYPNSIFWQAPIATDGGSQGNMAEVGYFIRWTGGMANLCRFFVNPSDANYQIYTAAGGNWVTPAILNSEAPADNVGNDHYQGLFLENVLGLWVQAYGYAADGVTPVLLSNPSYDSSSPPPAFASHPLPAYAIISIAVLDIPSAQRLKALSGLGTGATTPAALIAPYYNTINYPNAESAVEAMRTNSSLTSIRGGLSAATLTVNLENYK